MAVNKLFLLLLCTLLSTGYGRTGAASEREATTDMALEQAMLF